MPCKWGTAFSRSNVYLGKLAWDTGPITWEMTVESYNQNIDLSLFWKDLTSLVLRFPCQASFVGTLSFSEQIMWSNSENHAMAFGGGGISLSHYVHVQLRIVWTNISDRFEVNITQAFHPQGLPAPMAMIGINCFRLLLLPHMKWPYHFPLWIMITESWCW